MNGGLVIRRKIKASIEGGANPMAKCDICGKGVSFGIKVSHSHRRTNRAFKPNVQKVKAKAAIKIAPCNTGAFFIIVLLVCCEFSIDMKAKL